jgi:aspartate kinase
MMDAKWVVSKFGGSSVKDAPAMLRCCQIVESNPFIKILVISATQNTTNLLEQVANAASLGNIELLNSVTLDLITKHTHIAQDLFTSPVVMDELEVLFGELKVIGSEILAGRFISPKKMDELYSLGERISSLLISDLLRLRIPNKKIILLDARKIIKTNSNFQSADPLIEVIQKNTNENIIPFLEDDIIFVTQGFIGQDLLGNTTTLGREGSDYSAALFGEALEAGLVQIWTDVPGIASSDPRIIEDAKFIKEISYDEATALASLGAKILFPTTLAPTKRKNIPVFVGSSLNPSLGGTLITKNQDSQFNLKGVSQLVTKDLTLISFVGTLLNVKLNLADLLLKELGEELFDFFEQTEFSISFRVLSSDLSSNESLIIAHDVLTKFKAGPGSSI